MTDVRLIDANALPNYKCQVTATIGDRKGPAEMRFVFWQDIEKAPTIDAVPVVHGRWVRNDLGHAYCSKCYERIPFMHCYTEEPCSDYDEEWDEEIPETRYCPNCGAKMRCDNEPE